MYRTRKPKRQGGDATPSCGGVQIQPPSFSRGSLTSSASVGLFARARSTGQRTRIAGMSLTLLQWGRSTVELSERPHYSAQQTAFSLNRWKWRGDMIHTSWLDNLIQRF